MVEFVSAASAWVAKLLGPSVDWKQTILVGMSPIFLLAFMVEFTIAKRGGRTAQFHWKEVGANLVLGTSYQVMEALAWMLGGAATFSAVYQHRLLDIPVNGWTVLPVFVLVEFCYYWFHRCSHRVRWWWAAHVPHHSGEFMNFTTAMRQSVLNSFVGVFLFFLPPVLLGVPPAVVMFMVAVDLAYQYFVHTEEIGKLPAWFEYIFNTPSSHRVHHGRNAQYIDKNFGGVLIVFDRLFGTFEPEVERVDYGIPRQIRSYNFLVLNFHEFVDMMRDILAPGPWRQRLKHLWMPPDWERQGHAPLHTWAVERQKAGPSQSADLVPAAVADTTPAAG